MPLAAGGRFLRTGPSDGRLLAVSASPLPDPADLRERMLAGLREVEMEGDYPEGWAEEMTDKVLGGPDGGSLGPLPKILFKLDPTIPEGKVAVGGAIVLSDPTDEELGWAIGAKLVRARDEKMLSKVIGQACQDIGAVELKWIED